MRARGEPRFVRSGWPFVRAEGAGVAVTLEIRGGPSQRSELAGWYARQRAEALAAIHEAQAAFREVEPDTEAQDADALLTTANTARERYASLVESSAGWLILWAWCDAGTDLDAAVDYDAGKFQGPTARTQAGAATVAELLAAGWSWEAISDVADGIASLLKTGRPPGQEVAELRPFGAVTTSPT